MAFIKGGAVSAGEAKELKKGGRVKAHIGRKNGGGIGGSRGSSRPDRQDRTGADTSPMSSAGHMSAPSGAAEGKGPDRNAKGFD